MELNRTETVTDWDKWKHSLSKAVNLGQAVGLSQETIEKAGVKIGNALSSVVDPENREQRLLQEMWKVGDDDDRHVLSKLIIKMVETDNKD
mgnify:CR=1 FL=1